MFLEASLTVSSEFVASCITLLKKSFSFFVLSSESTFSLFSELKVSLTNSVTLLSIDVPTGVDYKYSETGP